MKDLTALEVSAGLYGHRGPRRNQGEEEREAAAVRDGAGGSQEQPWLGTGGQRSSARSLPHLAGSSREMPAATCDLAPVPLPPGWAEVSESGVGAGRGSPGDKPVCWGFAGGMWSPTRAPFIPSFPKQEGRG